MTASTLSTLTEADLSGFSHLGIPRDLLDQAQVRRVTDHEARRDFGIAFDATKDVSGILFPYFSVVDGHRTTARVRRDHPDIDAKGKEHNKYLSGYADPRHLYALPGAAQKLVQKEIPAVLAYSGSPPGSAGEAAIV